MNVWLCPIKPRSWRIVKKRGVFAGPKRVSRVFNQLKPGDMLVFHLLKPVNGIVAIGEVVSDVYEEYNSFWGKGQYPLRVRVKFAKNLVTDAKKAIPLVAFLGKISDSEIEISPFLKNIWLTQVAKSQYDDLLKLFESV